ncbi:MAG: cytochrome c biogenesis protein [uncultured bacterium]|nr:MAG: cytochrome c biogenesis protein [uncultured bacterium]
MTTTGYAAPDIIGITNWLNSEPLTLDELKGKVVLIDFWTYTCINCIRTLPHVQGWYEQYQDDGLMVIGVHSPEFEFEKDTGNVQDAIEMYGLTYPVAQDNDFATWKNYNNRYWPAKYLIDAEGNIRYTHFGEGEYDKTESAIRELLAEAGATLTDEVQDLPDETSLYSTTPETYLGLGRIDRFASNEPIQYGVSEYSFPDVLPVHNVAFNGLWDVEAQYAEANVGSQLRLHFKAADVFLVIKPAGAGDTITVNGEIIILDSDRLYQLYSNDVIVDDELTITFNDPSTQVFAFTFGS